MNHEEIDADERLHLLLLDLIRQGTSSEKLLAAWLIKTRAVNHTLRAQIEQIKDVPK